MFQERRQVEFRRKPRILAHADERAVEINLKITFRPADMQDDAARRPVGGQAESAAVNAGRIFIRHERRTVLKRHFRIGVNRFVERILKRPVGGYGNRAPGTVVQFRRGELLREKLWGAEQFETPFPVEADLPRRSILPERNARPMHRQAVDFGDFGQAIKLFQHTCSRFTAGTGCAWIPTPPRTPGGGNPVPRK